MDVTCVIFFVLGLIVGGGIGLWNIRRDERLVLAGDAPASTVVVPPAPAKKETATNNVIALPSETKKNEEKKQ